MELTLQEKVKVKKRFEATARKLWMESPYRNNALKRAKEKITVGIYKNGKDKTEVRYRCAKCDRLFKDGGVEVDHIKELHRISWRVPIEVETEDLVAWLISLFCELDNLQVLCTLCHAKKTAKYARDRMLGIDAL